MELLTMKIHVKHTSILSRQFAVSGKRMPSALNIPTQQRLSTRYFDIYSVLLFGDYICNEKDF